MRFNRIFSVLLTCIMPVICNCQTNDFGIWYGVSAGMPVSKKIDADLSAVIRTFEDASKIDQIYFEGGLSYKFNKHFSLSGFYRLIENNDNSTGFHIRHRLFSDFKGSYQIGQLAFSARMRFQIQKRTFIENESDKIPDYYGRIKFRALYKIPEFPLNPYLCLESFHPMFSSSDMFIDKKRLTAGIEYKISKKHSIEAEYLIERDYLPNLSDISILSVNYKFSF